MEIVIQRGEGLSQAIKRTLKNVEGIENKQFIGNVWGQIQSVLKDGKSTLKHNQNEQLIGDLWQPINKNVRTQINDVINIDNDTWEMIVGIFKPNKKEPEENSVQAAVEEKPINGNNTETLLVPPEESNVVSVEQAANPEGVMPQERIPESTSDIDAVGGDAEVDEDVQVIDIETVKRNEKRSITFDSPELKHDETILMYRAADLLVNAANMEEKPDVESGQESDYFFQRVTLANNRSIELRTDESGNRTVHVVPDRKPGNFLYEFNEAEVVYNLAPDGSSRAAVIYDFGHDDREQFADVAINKEDFQGNMNNILKKLFCE